MKSRGALIRDYLREHGPTCSAAIAHGIDLPALPVQHTIGNLFRSGILGREGMGRSFRYFLLREVPEPGPRKTKEEKRARQAQRERERARLKGRLSIEEYRLALAQRKAQRLAETDARKQARLAALRIKPAAKKKARVVLTPEQRIEKRREFERARWLRRKAEQKQSAVAVAEVTLVPDPIPQVQVSRESVEDWMARTGKRPEVLPIGAVSNPLRYCGGHRGINDASWRESQNAA